MNRKLLPHQHGTEAAPRNSGVRLVVALDGARRAAREIDLTSGTLGACPQLYDLFGARRLRGFQNHVAL